MMSVPIVFGLFLLSVAQTLAQLTKTDPQLGPGSPLYSGPVSQAYRGGQSPFTISLASRFGGQQAMMMADPRMGGAGGQQGSPMMMMADPRMGGAGGQQGPPMMMMADPRMGGAGGQQGPPMMMMADPRMGGAGGQQGPPMMMMADPRMSGAGGQQGPPMMMMADPRMGGAGFGGQGPMQGGYAMNPALYRGQMGGGYGPAMGGRGMPMQFQGGPMGQGSPYGAQMSSDGYMGPYGGGANELSGPMGGGMGGMGGMGGLDDGQIITAGSGMPGGAGYGPMGGPGGVSFFPFARVRPGPGLVIISTKESGDDNTSSSAGNNMNPFDLSFLNSNDTDAAFNGTLIDLPDDILSDNITADATVVVTPVVSGPATTANVTVSAVSGAPPTVTTTPVPCTHPVYMNRQFMATALQMGLIAANTSCVVLIDH